MMRVGSHFLSLLSQERQEPTEIAGTGASPSSPVITEVRDIPGLTEAQIVVSSIRPSNGDSLPDQFKDWCRYTSSLLP